jgi:hypothetical protein
MYKLRDWFEHSDKWNTNTQVILKQLFKMYLEGQEGGDETLRQDMQLTVTQIAIRQVGVPVIMSELAGSFIFEQEREMKHSDNSPRPMKHSDNSPRPMHC